MCRILKYDLLHKKKTFLYEKFINKTLINLFNNYIFYDII